MSQPWGYAYRNDRGLRGWLARRWLRHRQQVIAEQLRRRRH